VFSGRERPQAFSRHAIRWFQTHQKVIRHARYFLEL
jgi:hypothetical protein